MGTMFNHSAILAGSHTSSHSSSVAPWNRIRRSVQGTINMKDEDGFKPARESTHLNLPTRYELANGFTSIPSRLLGDLEEKHLPQTFSIATRVAHDGIRIVVTSDGARFLSGASTAQQGNAPGPRFRANHGDAGW